MKIAVVTDSGTTMNKEEANQNGLYFLPLMIHDEDKVYQDGIDITNDEVFDLIRQERPLKTSFAPLGVIKDVFSEILEAGYDYIVAVPLSAGLSGEMQAMTAVAQDIGIGITCIETYTTAYIQKYIALAAKKLVDLGKSLEDILALLEESIKHSNTILIADDLDHLKRGGRLTPMAASLAGMLKIKPILALNPETGGRVGTVAKVRTMSKAIQTAVKMTEVEGIDETYHVEVQHTISPVYVPEMINQYFGKYPMCESGAGYLAPIIAVHTGLGAVGLQYIKKISGIL